jgi:hypothetical protein
MTETWAVAPADRPTMDTIVTRLESLVKAIEAASLQSDPRASVRSGASLPATQRTSRVSEFSRLSTGSSAPEVHEYVDLSYKAAGLGDGDTPSSYATLSDPLASQHCGGTDVGEESYPPKSTVTLADLSRGLAENAIVSAGDCAWETEESTL